MKEIHSDAGVMAKDRDAGVAGKKKSVGGESGRAIDKLLTKTKTL